MPSPASRLLPALLAAVLSVSAATAAQATVFTFDTDPFAGTTALQTPGRQVIGNEQFIPAINLATDIFAVNAEVFGIPSTNVSFANTFAANLSGGQNVIVLEDLDAGGGRKANGNTLAAGTAANLIASTGKESGPGLFVYFNSTLNVSRLVFDTDLGSTTSDLKVLARFTGEVGQAGINDLPSFQASNFALTTAVSEPPSLLLLLGGMGGIGLARRRRQPASSAVASA